MNEHTKTVEGDGYRTIATFDPTHYRISVRTKSHSGLHLKTVYSMQMYMQQVKEDINPLDWAIKMHQSSPEFDKVVPDIKLVEGGQQFHIEVEGMTGTQQTVDFNKIKVKIEEVIKEAFAEPIKANVTTSLSSVPVLHKGGPVSWSVSPSVAIVNDISNAYKYKSISAGGVHPTISDLAKIFKGVDETVTHPVTGGKNRVYSIIMDLNDRLKWSREDIADWIESLDIDTTMVEGDNNENTNKDKAPT